jgi:hypothetical protein
MAGILMIAGQSGDADETRPARFLESHVGTLRPRVHVREQALAEILRRVVQKLHRQPRARLRPPVTNDHDKATRAAAPADGRAGYGASLVFVPRVDLDAAAKDSVGLLGGQDARPADDSGW